MMLCKATRNASLGTSRAELPTRLMVQAPQSRLCSMRAYRGLCNGLGTCFQRPALLQFAPMLSRRLTQSSSVAEAQDQSAGAPSHGSSSCTSSPAPPKAAPSVETSLPEQLRSAMRLLASPVVVCTSTHDGAPRGMTMSSFTSLALTPAPLVTFNVLTPSRTLDAIAASREFNIHILAGDAAGAAVADHFTRGNVEGAFEGLRGVRTIMASSRGPPLMSGDGVLRVLRCRLFRQGPEDGLVRVRDHVLVVGEVMEMIKGKHAREFGLAYADRTYRRVGDVIAMGGMRPEEDR